MRKSYFKIFVLIISFFALNNICQAKKVPGYIVLESADTVFGEVKLHVFSRTTGGIILNGVDMEWCHLVVSFRESNSKKFQVYQPKEILAYGFRYKSADFIFHSSILQQKSLFKNEQERQQFLHLIYSSRISLYVDLRYSSMLTKEQSYAYYEYYLYSSSVGLIKVEITKDIKTIHDLLLLYNVEIAFLDYIPFTTPLKDIKVVLMQYNEWIQSK